jgi:RNA polymerase sigma-70 factor (sigma-E family)
MPHSDRSEQQRFAEYVAARRAMVRRAAYLLCGDWDWADDLTQVAFVRLAAGWSRIREPQAVDAYLNTCLVRVYLAETRRVWRRRERTVAELPERVGDGDHAERQAWRAEVVAALRQLPARQRAVLVCRFYQELDQAACADALGCSIGTVKSQTSRGLARLRELLGVPVDPVDEVDEVEPPDTSPARLVAPKPTVLERGH